MTEETGPTGTEGNEDPQTTPAPSTRGPSPAGPGAARRGPSPAGPHAARRGPSPAGPHAARAGMPGGMPGAMPGGMMPGGMPGGMPPGMMPGMGGMPGQGGMPQLPPGVTPEMAGIPWNAADAQRKSEDELVAMLRSGEKSVKGATFAGFDFREKDLSDVEMPSVELAHSLLDKTNLLRANLAQSQVWQASMKEARLDHADLTGVTMLSVNMEDVSAIKATFTNARLPRVKAQRINLEGADLRGAVLDLCDLTGARLAGADLTGARLFGTKLEGADLTAANLVNVMAEGADLRGARLNDATLHHVMLKGANVGNTDFLGADFDDVNLEGANLLNAKLPDEMRRTWFNLAARQHPQDLYQRATAPAQVVLGLAETIYRAHYQRSARRLAQHYAGGGHYAIAWAMAHEENTGLIVEDDAELISWGLSVNAGEVGREDRKRIETKEGSSSDALDQPVDVVVAVNNVWCRHHDDDALRAYFTAARESLNDQGILLLDVFGGAVLEAAGQWTTDHGAFRYHWQHESFDPESRQLNAHMHFEFPDGSKREKVFSFDWKVWPLERTVELLKEAGFEDAKILVAQAVPDEPDTSRYVEINGPPNDQGWSAYVVAFRTPGSPPTDANADESGPADAPTDPPGSLSDGD